MSCLQKDSAHRRLRAAFALSGSNIQAKSNRLCDLKTINGKNLRQTFADLEIRELVRQIAGIGPNRLALTTRKSVWYNSTEYQSSGKLLLLPRSQSAFCVVAVLRTDLAD